MEHQKTYTMFRDKHNFQQKCPTQTLIFRIISAILIPKTPIIKFRTFEHFLKFLPDAKFKFKFRSCPEFSGRNGNPTVYPTIHHIFLYAKPTYCAHANGRNIQLSYNISLWPMAVCDAITTDVQSFSLLYFIFIFSTHTK